MVCFYAILECWSYIDRSLVAMGKLLFSCTADGLLIDPLLIVCKYGCKLLGGSKTVIGSSTHHTSWGLLQQMVASHIVTLIPFTVLYVVSFLDGHEQ